MKANINLLRGYDNSHYNARSVARADTPNVGGEKAKQQPKNRKSYFSKPDLYTLPTVCRSRKG